MANLVRVNTNISSEINEWLNARSDKTGISKSALILIALDSYRNQTEAISELPKMAAMMEMLTQMTQDGQLTVKSD